MPDQATIEEFTTSHFLKTQIARPTQLQCVFTKNVIAQWDGAPGPNGLGVRPAGNTPNPQNYYLFSHITEENHVQSLLIGSVKYKGWVLASHGIGSVFPYSGGFGFDQLWILEPVRDIPTTFRILNRHHSIYLYDPSEPGQEGVLDIDSLKQHDPQRYEWQFSVDNVLPA